MRHVIIQRGDEITEDSFAFIRDVEAASMPKAMRIFSSLRSISDITLMYECWPENIVLGRGIDWYRVVVETDRYFELASTASLPSRNVNSSRREMHAFLEEYVLIPSAKSGKNILASAKEDTSYKSLRRLIASGELELLEDSRRVADTVSSGKLVFHRVIMKPNIK